jgi:hypothetical protein
MSIHMHRRSMHTKHCFMTGPPLLTSAITALMAAVAAGQRLLQLLKHQKVPCGRLLLLRSRGP